MSNAESKDSRDIKERSPFFDLYDLRVEVIAPPGTHLLCGAKPGDWFELRGELLYMPPDQGFSIYSLAALLPLLPAKQRQLPAADWLERDCLVACPDPDERLVMRITRTGRTTLRTSDLT